MPEINKADVYRKAAEVIVRDGKYDAGLVPQKGKSTWEERVKDRSLPVCAIGACVRAEYELYGTVGTTMAAYDSYSYVVDGFEFHNEDGKFLTPYIENVNDHGRTTAEDIALLLKRRAEEVQGG